MTHPNVHWKLRCLAHEGVMAIRPFIRATRFTCASGGWPLSQHPRRRWSMASGAVLAALALLALPSNASGAVCGNGIVEFPEQCDSGSCCTRDCTFHPPGIPCRPPLSVCDVEEDCTGTSATCPSDTFVAAGTVCRASAGVCDVADSCTGTSPICPPDFKQPSGTVCRAAADNCDAGELCDGSSSSCPADADLPDVSSCTDGQFCNGAETCESGVCTDGPDPCTGSAICNQGTDTCEHPTPTGTPTPIDTPTPTATAIIYQFVGFFQPVDNPPTLNTVAAGRAIPVKFSLSGNQGLAIFAAGYPRLEPLSCPAGVSVDTIEQTVTAGGSSLSYDAATDRYTYTWKTQTAWAGQCGELVMRLIDGTSHAADFAFKAK